MEADVDARNGRGHCSKVTTVFPFLVPTLATREEG